MLLMFNNLTFLENTPTIYCHSMILIFDFGIVLTVEVDVFILLYEIHARHLSSEIRTIFTFKIECFYKLDFHTDINYFRAPLDNKLALNQ